MGKNTVTKKSASLIYGFALNLEELASLIDDYWNVKGKAKSMYIRKAPGAQKRKRSGYTRLTNKKQKPDEEGWHFECDYSLSDDVLQDVLTYEKGGYEVKFKEEFYHWKVKGTLESNIESSLREFHKNDLTVEFMNGLAFIYCSELGGGTSGNEFDCVELDDNLITVTDGQKTLLNKIKTELKINQNSAWFLMSF